MSVRGAGRMLDEYSERGVGRMSELGAGRMSERGVGRMSERQAWCRKDE